MIISYFGKEMDLGEVIELTDISIGIAGYSKTFEVYTANVCYTFDLTATSLRFYLGVPNDLPGKLIDIKTIIAISKEMIEDQFYHIHKQIEDMLNYEKTHKSAIK